MDFLFDNDRPIYVQLVDALRRAIVSGDFGPGARLPSVRELAMQAKVNPNTMQRALAQLEAEGLIYTERTNGKFVSQSPELISAQKSALAELKARAFLEEMEKLGLTPPQVMACLQKIGGEMEWRF